MEKSDITENSTRTQTYTNRRLRMTELTISEFYYELLHGIMNNNVFVSKWNKDVSPLCEILQDRRRHETSSV